MHKIIHAFYLFCIFLFGGLVRLTILMLISLIYDLLCRFELRQLIQYRDMQVRYQLNYLFHSIPERYFM
jgi:hypothetical protein